ncbi:MAG: hypothetical protein OEZ43_20320 [Gammaproteobacteria bacterium]|nr:hypothetical protein [Gammaproteobacteria bacterium]
MEIQQKRRINAHFLSASLIMGGLQIADGMSFLVHQQSNFNIAFSWLQLCWFIITLLCAFLLWEFSETRKIIATFLSYILCNIALATSIFEQNHSAFGYSIPAWFSLITVLTGFLLLYWSYRSIRRSAANLS